MTLRSLRSNIGVVQQDVYLFSGSAIVVAQMEHFSGWAGVIALALLQVPVRCLPDLPLDWKVERILRSLFLACSVK